jgi:hypothetical protein
VPTKLCQTVPGSTAPTVVSSPHPERMSSMTERMFSVGLFRPSAPYVTMRDHDHTYV